MAGPSGNPLVRLYTLTDADQNKPIHFDEVSAEDDVYLYVGPTQAQNSSGAPGWGAWLYPSIGLFNFDKLAGSPVGNLALLLAPLGAGLSPPGPPLNLLGPFHGLRGWVGVAAPGGIAPNGQITICMLIVPGLQRTFR